MASDTFQKWREEVFRSQAISPLRIGMLQEEVLALFGPPDGESTQRRQGKPVILKYRDSEFHFDSAADHRLCLIYSDEPDGTVRLCIPPR